MSVTVELPPHPRVEGARSHDAWTVVWRCGCSQGDASKDQLPERCPGHDSEKIAAPGNPWRGVEILYVGHDCGDQKCPEATAVERNRPLYRPTFGCTCEGCA